MKFKGRFVVVGIDETDDDTLVVAEVVHEDEGGFDRFDEISEAWDDDSTEDIAEPDDVRRAEELVLEPRDEEFVDPWVVEIEVVGEPKVLALGLAEELLIVADIDDVAVDEGTLCMVAELEEICWPLTVLLPSGACDDECEEIPGDAVLELVRPDIPEIELADLAELDPKLDWEVDEKVVGVPCPETELERLSEDEMELLVLPEVDPLGDIPIMLVDGALDEI